MSTGPGDEAGLIVDEHVVLLKFDGDVTPEAIDAGEHEPVARLVIHNGEVVENWEKED